MEHAISCQWNGCFVFVLTEQNENVTVFWCLLYSPVCGLAFAAAMMVDAIRVLDSLISGSHGSLQLSSLHPLMASSGTKYAEVLSWVNKLTKPKNIIILILLVLVQQERTCYK